MLNRGDNGALSGAPIDTTGIKAKTFKTERRQFAEAVLSRAVLAVEGSTEAAIFPEASSIMEKARGSTNYTHFDLAGVTVFDAGGDGSVPRFGPVFKALGKTTFGLYDKPAAPLSGQAIAQLADYTHHWESPHSGAENLLAEEVPVPVLRRFLDSVKDRPDYPPHHRKPAANMNDAAVKDLARKLLKDRKGEAHGYAALLIAECKTENELPATIRSVLAKIQDTLTPPAVQPGGPQPEVSGEPAAEAPKPAVQTAPGADGT
jgi:putative ATP-dependent endonuclease of OLD family